MAALKTGEMAGLQVRPQVLGKASQFLDHVQAESGAKYGYTGPGSGPATTAIGLLCRMYQGWNQDNPALQRGVEWISNRGVSTSGAMYWSDTAGGCTSAIRGRGAPAHRYDNLGFRVALVPTQ